MQYQIGDFLKRIRVPVTIEDSKTYRLVTIRMNHKGVVLREEKLGSAIGTKTMYRVSAGQFILSGIDARNGAFGIVPEELDGAVVTNDFWYFEIDRTIISKDYFLYLTSTPLFAEIVRKASDGTTNRVRLQADKFYNYQISLPDVADQATIISEVIKHEAAIRIVQAELQTQQTLLTKLRQAILHEAVQGKLTAKWREERGLAEQYANQQVLGSSPGWTAPKQLETGAELLAKIRAEKAELIRQGKLRKEKSLPPITDAEKPFELPEGWVWCRLGDLGTFCGGGTPSKNNPDYWKGEVPWVSPKDIKMDYIYDSIDHISTDAIQNSSAKLIEPNSILMVVRGMTLLKRFPTAINKVPVTLNQDVKAITFYSEEVMLYIFTCLKGLENLVLKVINTATHGTGKLDTELIVNFLIPLPPLTEQQVIVAQEERLLQQVNRLEAENKQQQEGVGRLMQAVLREAFAGKETVNEQLPLVI